MDLRELQINSWKVSEDHGFHQAQLGLPPKTLANYLKLFLIIGELCEAGEELRAGRHPQEVYYKHDITGTPEGTVYNERPWCALWMDQENHARVEYFMQRPTHKWQHQNPDAVIRMGKPEGFPIELADALIRLTDLAEDTGVDLSEVTEIKETYNRTREFMHGKTA